MIFKMGDEIKKERGHAYYWKYKHITDDTKINKCHCGSNDTLVTHLHKTFRILFSHYILWIFYFFEKKNSRFKIS